MENLALEKKIYRKFGFTLAAGISLMFGLILPWIFDRPVPEIPFLIAILLAAWALVIPGTLKIIYRPWMKISHVIGHFNTRLVLALIFYLIFTPTALILKLSGKDAMARRTFKSKNCVSYWRPVSRQPSHHMENIY
jgi:hypothetical protein